MVGPVYERVRHEEYCEKLDPEECELLDLLANLCDETLTYKVQFS